VTLLPVGDATDEVAGTLQRILDATSQGVGASEPVGGFDLQPEQLVRRANARLSDSRRRVRLVSPRRTDTIPSSAAATIRARAGASPPSRIARQTSTARSHSPVLTITGARQAKQTSAMPEIPCCWQKSVAAA
jgi:hypothetical protein